MNSTDIIKFHEATAECWRARGKDLFSEAHAAGAEAIRRDAPLTDHEKAGNERGVMQEVAKGAMG